MAIIGPGECAYKDYIDLYFILSEHHATLTDLIDVAEKKFGVEFNLRLFLDSASSKRTPWPMLSASSSRPVHHNPNTSQIPAATKPAPAIREIRRPTGIIFSMSTKAEIMAIHSTFITPPTNKSAINTQQQPTQ
jgi:hypothetical protein